MTSQYDIDHRSRVERDAAILADAKIYAKATAHHAVQFRERYPQQVEMVLRLTAERLQNGLHKESQAPLSNEDVNHLAQAMLAIHTIYASR